MDLMMFQFQSADTARAEWKEYLPLSSVSSAATTYELLSIIPEIATDSLVVQRHSKFTLFLHYPRRRGKRKRRMGEEEEDEEEEEEEGG